MTPRASGRCVPSGTTKSAEEGFRRAGDDRATLKQLQGKWRAPRREDRLCCGDGALVARIFIREAILFQRRLRSTVRGHRAVDFDQRVKGSRRSASGAPERGAVVEMWLRPSAPLHSNQALVYSLAGWPGARVWRFTEPKL